MAIAPYHCATTSDLLTGDIPLYSLLTTVVAFDQVYKEAAATTYEQMSKAEVCVEISFHSHSGFKNLHQLQICFSIWMHLTAAGCCTQQKLWADNFFKLDLILICSEKKKYCKQKKTDCQDFSSKRPPTQIKDRGRGVYGTAFSDQYFAISFFSELNP